MFIIIFACLLALSEAFVSNIIQTNIEEDGPMDFAQLASKYERECEEFDIVTEDGYILKLFHITGNESKKPVLLMHGLMDSSDTFIIRGNISIAINLSEADFDVWAGNVRGNKYSRKHVKLSPVKDKKAFWDFSFHETGIYDLPAIIDFILKRTGKEKLSAIGHSQGTTIFYALGSAKPEYNEKISVFISLAPIAYLNDISPALSGLIKLWPATKLFFESLGYEGVLRDHSAETEFIQFLCTQGPLAYDACERGLISSITGDDSEELEPKFFDLATKYFPAGTSLKSFAHFVQIANSARFAQYNYGVKKNLLVYNSTSSPVYNLSKATMPIVLLAGKNDGLSGIKDVERLMSELPNVVRYHVMEREKFNHIDYVWGEHLNVYITPLLRQLLST